MSIPESYDVRRNRKITIDSVPITTINLVQKSENEFDVNGIHKTTKTKFNPDGFDRTGYNKDGFDIDGNDILGFNEVGIHKATKTEFDLHEFDVNGIHKTTKTKFNPDGHDRDKCVADDYRLEEYLKYYVDEREYDPEKPHDRVSEEESHREVESSEVSDISESEAET